MIWPSDSGWPVPEGGVAAVRPRSSRPAAILALLLALRQRRLSKKVRDFPLLGEPFPAHLPPDNVSGGYFVARVGPCIAYAFCGLPPAAARLSA